MKKNTIAVLDLDKSTFPLIESMLGDKYDYSFHSTAQEYMDKGGSQLHKLIICEAYTQGVDSRKLCKEIGKSLPIIFVSSLDKDCERRKCLLNKNHIYLTKPYTKADLQKALDSKVN